MRACVTESEDNETGGDPTKTTGMDSIPTGTLFCDIFINSYTRLSLDFVT